MQNIHDEEMYECVFIGCHCQFSAGDEIIRTPAGMFCSEGCAEGKGCHHINCNCASFKQE